MSGFGQVLTAVAAAQEFDLDGGNLTGTIQPWIATCFPGLDELDLSFNQVSPCLQGSCAAALRQASCMQKHCLRFERASLVIWQAQQSQVSCLLAADRYPAYLAWHLERHSA